MKKFVMSWLMLLVLACSTVYASNKLNESISPNQCPPASALTHKGFGAHWVINDAYKKLGWYVSSYPYSDMTAATYLKDDVSVWANIRSNEDNNRPNWFVTCEYDVSYGAFPRYVVITKNQFLKGAPPLPNFTQIDPTQYQCMGQSDKLNCPWDSIAK